MIDLLKEYIPPVLFRLCYKLYNFVKKRIVKPSKLEEQYLALNKRNEKGRITFRDGLEFSCYPNDIVAVDHYCFRSPDMVKEMDQFLSMSNECKAFLDIGAFQGVFTLAFLASKNDARALSIDPSPVAFSKLLYNKFINNFDAMECVHCAVSDDKGYLNMKLRGQQAIMATEDEDHFKVPILVTDDICEKYGFSPDVIKVDVEGHEVKVFRGIKNTLIKSKPMIFLEVHHDWIAESGDSINEMFNLFDELGYCAINLDGEPVSFEVVINNKSIDRIVLIQEKCA